MSRCKRLATRRRYFYQGTRRKHFNSQNRPSPDRVIKRRHVFVLLRSARSEWQVYYRFRPATPCLVRFSQELGAFWQFMIRVHLPRFDTRVRPCARNKRSCCFSCAFCMHSDPTSQDNFTLLCGVLLSAQTTDVQVSCFVLVG